MFVCVCLTSFPRRTPVWLPAVSGVFQQAFNALPSATLGSAAGQEDFSTWSEVTCPPSLSLFWHKERRPDQIRPTIKVAFNCEIRLICLSSLTSTCFTGTLLYSSSLLDIYLLSFCDDSECFWLCLLLDLDDSRSIRSLVAAELLPFCTRSQDLSPRF